MNRHERRALASGNANTATDEAARDRAQVFTNYAITEGATTAVCRMEPDGGMAHQILAAGTNTVPINVSVQKGKCGLVIGRANEFNTIWVGNAQDLDAVIAMLQGARKHL